MAKATVDVAIAILLHKSKVLVGWRQANQHQGNKHEFPGGKVELGETPEQACRREIFEEVGIGLKDWHVFDRMLLLFQRHRIFGNPIHITVRRIVCLLLNLTTHR